MVNHAFFGVNRGSLPANAALTSTVTTTIEAPAITLSKTDGRATAEPGDALIYTLCITNSGSIAATGLVITDVLPADVNYTPGTATPPETSWAGQTLVWTDLGPIAPDGGTVVITIPVTVAPEVPYGTILTNTMTVKYENTAGWVFATKTATDTTLVSKNIAFIEGYTFIDANGDGVYDDASEGTLSDITVALPDATVPVTTTDVNGYYHFQVESEGSISVTAALPGGYFRTTPGTVFLESIFGITQTVNFGYASTSSNFAAVYGIVFEDTNGNGVQNLGEAGIQDVTVTLDGSDTTTTDASGYYVFTTTVVGTHTVVETDPDGYSSTTPNTVTLSVALNQGYQVDFGDALTTAPGPSNIYLPVILRNY